MGRLGEIDILKGLLIILVVAGHALPDARYIFWFHMPCFFMVAGFFFRPPSGTLRQYVREKSFRLMLPYLSYTLFFAAAYLLAGNTNLGSGSSFSLLYGGRLMTGVYNAYWFVPVLFLSLCGLAWFSSSERLSSRMAWIMLGCYAAAHAVSMAATARDVEFALPLNIDVCLLAMPYIWMGSLLFRMKDNLRGIHLVLAVIALVMLVAADQAGMESFRLDMKPGLYTFFIYDMAVPLLGMAILYKASLWLTRFAPLSAVLSYIGRSSFTIMFIHFAVLIVCKTYIPVLNDTWKIVAAIVLGVAIPVAANFVIMRIKPARMLFAGTK